MTELRLTLWLLILIGSAATWAFVWRRRGGTAAPRWRSDAAAAGILGSVLVSVFVLQLTGARETPWWFGALLIAGGVVFALALWVERGRPWS